MYQIFYLKPHEYLLHPIIAIACAAASMAFTYYATKQDGKETEVNLTKTISDQASEIKRLSSQNIDLSNTIFRNTQQIKETEAFLLCTLAVGKIMAIRHK